MLEEYLSISIFHFMLIFARLSVVFIMLPGLSAGYVPVRIRLVVGLLITLLMLPMLQANLPPEPQTASELVWMIVGEALIGGFLGALIQVVMAALELAGEVISQATGLTNAFVDDPVSEEQSALVISFINLIVVVLIFVTDVHQVMLIAIVDSYTMLTPGGQLFTGDMTETMSSLLNRSFMIGLQLAAPFLVFKMVFHVTSAVLARLSPQLNVFFVGLPAQILVGFGILMVALPAMMLLFMGFMDDALNGLLTR